MENQEQILIELVELVQKMVEESGNSVDFNARIWVEAWITKPSFALGGRRPCDFFSTRGGIAIIKNKLKQIQSGSY